MKRKKFEEILTRYRVALRGGWCKFRRLAQVEDEWVPHYSAFRDRYKFLVLTGRSRTGKTRYAMHLFGDVSRTLELNCAAASEPDLRTFDPEHHSAVLFDEASAAMVLKQKKLFQAPPCWIQLGASTTNCHSYEVVMAGCKMIICSNRWDEELEALGEADREWLNANSVKVRVDDPFWIEDS